MPKDYVLFIIILPNDFNAENSLDLQAEASYTIQKESSIVTVNTVSMLESSTKFPHAIPSTISSQNKEDNEHESVLNLRIPSKRSICALLQDYLAQRSDVDAVWMISQDKKTFQIIFNAEFGCVSNRLLQDLADMDVGKENDTKILVLPTTVVLKGDNHEKNRSSTSLSLIEDTNFMMDNKSSSVYDEAKINPVNNSTCNNSILSSKTHKYSHESELKKRVRAQILVHQVVANIRASLTLSFDFILLICLASILSVFGLLENSTVIIVASMFVSPLMNPILGIVFGLTVCEHSLWKRGFRNELISLIICIVNGFILGLLTTYNETAWGHSTSFPTYEMQSRGDFKRLWLGILIALPSGAGIALSVLGENTGSLVGVAISASLLPPSVNCGLLFAYALLGVSFPNIAVIDYSSQNNTKGEYLVSRHCQKYVNNDYQPLYTCNLATEAAILACCSLLLTIVNIICILIMALLILRLKEVVPFHQTNRVIERFFHYDIKIARHYNKKIYQCVSDDKNSTTSTYNRKRIAQSIINRSRALLSSISQQQQEQSLSSSAINIDLESHHDTDASSNDILLRQKLYRFNMFVQEYDLDIFNKDDYKLTSFNSQDKARLLVSDLIDICEEIPSVFAELYRLQLSGIYLTPVNKENMLFYQEIIGVLPSKWYELFIDEQQQRQIESYPLKFGRSCSMYSYPLEFHKRSMTELNDHNHPPSTHHKNETITVESGQCRTPNKIKTKPTRMPQN